MPFQQDVKPFMFSGYDLSDWLCSRNPFANINGFGAFSTLDTGNVLGWMERVDFVNEFMCCY